MSRPSATTGFIHLRGEDNERSLCGAEMIGLGDVREVICIARKEWNIIRAAITPAEFVKTYCQKCAVQSDKPPIFELGFVDYNNERAQIVRFIQKWAVEHAKARAMLACNPPMSESVWRLANAIANGEHLK